MGTGKQVISGSDDGTARIWNIQRKKCTKIFTEYANPVIAVACSPSSILLAFADGVVNVYDSQSNNIIHAIKSEHPTHCRLSIKGDTFLVARKDSGYIWDLTKKKHAWSVFYNGDCAMFSPDGTYVASMYGKFLKIWKTNLGHLGGSTLIHGAGIGDIHLSSDDRLVGFKSEKGVEVLDATTGLSLFTPADGEDIGFSPDGRIVAFKCRDTAEFFDTTTWLPLFTVGPRCTSIAFSPDSAFVACVLVNYRPWSVRVQIWNVHTFREQGKSIKVDHNTSDIGLSPNGSQVASVSQCYIKLWDLESKNCLALLQLQDEDEELAYPQDGNSPWWGVRVSFAANGASISLPSAGGTKSWRITDSPTRNINLATNSIDNRGGSKSWLVSPISHTKLPMVFVPIMEMPSDQDASAPSQSYRCDMNGEWMVDQHGRRVLWIPPDERPRGYESNRFGSKVVVETESRKVYIVDFHGLEKTGT